MQCTGNSSCSQLRGKRAAIARHKYPGCLLLLCAMFSCFHTTGCEAYTLLRPMDMGSLTCAQIRARAVHTKEERSGTKKSAQELIRADRKTICHPPCPARGSNPGYDQLCHSNGQNQGYIILLLLLFLLLSLLLLLLLKKTETLAFWQLWKSSSPSDKKNASLIINVRFFTSEDANLMM